MLPPILSLIALGLVAAAVSLWRGRHTPPDEVTPSPAPSRPPGCCGQHEICEKESLLAAVSREVEYYDDEELDAYAGIPSSDYTEAQAEAFRDVLYTMRSDEVAGWVRSLQLRGVELPDELKDEVFLIVGERRGL